MYKRQITSPVEMMKWRNYKWPNVREMRNFILVGIKCEVDEFVMVG
jgi:hypothetical protein